MVSGIKDKVAIIGMGCTKFGERWEVGSEELMVEAFQEAIEDAGIDPKEIQAAWLGTCMEEVSVGKSALPLSLTLRLPDDVAVEVDIEGGLSDIEAPDFTEQPQGYVNDAYETAERELHIEVKVGIGRVSLIEVSD